MSPGSGRKVNRRKKFSEDLYNRYNQDAIDRVIRYLADVQGIYSSVNPDKYGPDIIVYAGFTEIQYVEVEVKLAWKKWQTDFPFSTVQLPERKGKFAGLHIPTEFWILREDMEAVAVIPDYTLSMYQPVEVSNKYIESGEYFYQIPVESIQVIYLGEER